MKKTASVDRHTRRLEKLWGGDFGDAYVQRNKDTITYRRDFWEKTLRRLKPRRVLEVGCNLGANLAWIGKALPPENIYGCDINAAALRRLRGRMAGVNAVLAAARDLPFKDGWFDLVFTMGVLIHQPPSGLARIMREIARCSSRYVLMGEYHAAKPVEIPYRGRRGALFKRDFGADFQKLCPRFRLIQKGFLPKKTGWDDITYWILEKRR